jgi:formate hydrogenlyase transcriptional activator
VAELEPFHAKRANEVSMSGLAEVERDHIVRALEASDWVVGGKNGAAARLGMKRTSLVYRMQKLKIKRQGRGGDDGRKARG